MLVIAEAGVNHNGDEQLAFKLIDAAYAAGADIVKFQTFKAKNLVTPAASQAAYQRENTKKSESQLSMLSRLELSHETHHKLVRYSESLGIGFLSTAFDLESLAFLVNDLELKQLKISSGELTNTPLLLEHARTGVQLIVSTGMATLSEIEMALSVIAFGYVGDDVKPCMSAFQNAYASAEGQKSLRENVIILHCTSEYPAPVEEINLRVIDTLTRAFELPVGYSDHSEGIAIPVAAVARGAVVIEKHFTLDRYMEGPDHLASLEPKELQDMINSIRQVEVALGSGVKIPTPSEVKNKIVGRKSIVASREIEKGALLTSENITCKRPGNGLSPHLYWDVIDRYASQDYLPGDMIVE